MLLNCIFSISDFDTGYSLSVSITAKNFSLNLNFITIKNQEKIMTTTTVKQPTVKLEATKPVVKGIELSLEQILADA